MAENKAGLIFSFVFLAMSVLLFVNSYNGLISITGYAAYIDIDFSKIGYSEVDLPVNNSITFSLDGVYHDLRILDVKDNQVRAYVDKTQVFFLISQKKDFDLNYDNKADITILIDNAFSNSVHVIMTKVSCTPDWFCSEYKGCVSGTQSRECYDKNKCGTTQSVPELSRTCVESCQDNILNQGEKEIDCGGPCSPCKNNNLIYLWALVPILVAGLIMGVIYFVIKRKERPYRALEKPLITEIAEDKPLVKEAIKQSGIIPKSKEELEALQQLEDYINEALSRRVSINDIKENLVSVGWEERIVDLTLTKIIRKQKGI